MYSLHVLREEEEKSMYYVLRSSIIVPVSTYTVATVLYVVHTTAYANTTTKSRV